MYIYTYIHKHMAYIFYKEMITIQSEKNCFLQTITPINESRDGIQFILLVKCSLNNTMTTILLLVKRAIRVTRLGRRSPVELAGGCRNWAT